MYLVLRLILVFFGTFRLLRSVGDVVAVCGLVSFEDSGKSGADLLSVFSGCDSIAC